ncbi:MAG: tetratricopeptide repeat protein, partial [Anaerolineae bacterium]
FPFGEEVAARADGISTGYRLADKDVTGWEDYDAVKLMLQSIRRVCPERSLSAQERRALLQVCQLVEGMPLALELAAGWARVMPLPEIVRQIRQDLDFLMTPLPDIPARHRSIRVLFEHSWELLTEKEREVVKGASVFHGSFQLAALEHLTDASLPLLAALVNKSMLRVQPSGRYDMHGLLGQFAEDKMQEIPGEADRLRLEHCRYYLGALRETEADLQGVSQREASAQIAADIGNIRAAWRWAVAHQMVTDIAEGCESLHLFYFVRGLIDEGLQSFGEAVDSLRALGHKETTGEQGQVKLVLGRLLARQGRFAYRLGLYRQAQELLEESLMHLEQLEAAGYPGARRERAFSLYHLGILLRGDGQYDEARKACHESLTIYQGYGDQLGIARARNLLGMIAGASGDYEESKEQLQRALERYSTTGDEYGSANILNDLSVVALRQGQLAEARRLQRECLARRRKLGHLWGIGTSLNNLGYFAYLDQEYAEARQLLQEGLAIQREIGDQYHIANCLNNLGIVASAAGDYREASNFFSEALNLALEVGALPLVLEALAETALLLLAGEMGDKAQVAETLSFVQQHPASDKPTQQKVEQRLAGLAEELAPETMALAQERSQDKDLEMVVAEILSQVILDRAD